MAIGLPCGGRWDPQETHLGATVSSNGAIWVESGRSHSGVSHSEQGPALLADEQQGSSRDDLPLAPVSRRQEEGRMKTFVRFMDWPLHAKMMVLLVVASLLPLGVAAFIDIREAQQRLLANTAALLAARSDQLVRELDPTFCTASFIFMNIQR
jgi:hypothetical protein